MVRVRIAPSPTGALHIGTARTALFNYLFARKNNGKFLLRFEDTDQSRSTKESEENILEGLKWLGLSWDEKPVYQMERLDLYKKKADELVKGGFAYEKDGAIYCDVKKIIDKFNIPNKPVKVLVKDFENNKEVKSEKPGYLIVLPENDLILGKISANVEDFVLIRQNGIPTFHFAVVIDDEDMKITHVIRGQDHSSNTPKHYLLQKVLGYTTPKYAHIPLTLNADGTKLSKRTGAVSVSDFKEQGYLPEALINFIVFLGWNPKSEREIFSLKELENEFKIENMNKSSAVFNIERLNWFNQHYIREKNSKELTKSIKEGFLNIKITDQELEKLVEIEKQRLVKLSDFSENIKWFLEEPKYKRELLIFKKSDKEKTRKGLSLGLENLEKVNSKNWTIENLHKILNDIVEKSDLSFGDVFWPVRVALSGQEKSPSPEELLWVLGKEKSLKRIEKAISLLKG